MMDNCLMEMIGGGKFSIKSPTEPDTSRLIKSDAPDGEFGIQIAHNSYRVLGVPYTDEQIEQLLHRKREPHFVTITPLKGMKVKTPNGRGIIEYVGDDYIIVDGVEFQTHECIVLDVMLTALDSEED